MEVGDDAEDCHEWIGLHGEVDTVSLPLLIFDVGGLDTVHVLA